MGGNICCWRYLSFCHFCRRGFCQRCQGSKYGKGQSFQGTRPNQGDDQDPANLISLCCLVLLLLAATMATAGYSQILPPVPLGRVLLFLICMQTLRRSLQRLRSFRRVQDQQQGQGRTEHTGTIGVYSDEGQANEWDWAENEVEAIGSLALYTSSSMLGEDDDLAYPSCSQGLGMSLGLCTQSYNSLTFA